MDESQSDIFCIDSDIVLKLYTAYENTQAVMIIEGVQYLLSCD